MIKYRRRLIVIAEISAVIAFIYLTVFYHSQSSFDMSITSPENYTLVSTPSSNESFFQYTYLKEVFQTRRDRVQTMCKSAMNNRYRGNLPISVTRRFFVDRKHNISWCPIYKAASSTFLTIFAELGGVLTTEAKQQIQKGKLQINNLARKAFPLIVRSRFKEVVSTSNRLLVVRHPFERLLSAYRDKLEHKENREFYHRKYGISIVKKYGNINERDVPTFREFLQFVADRQIFDEHWRPYHLECAPCQIDYNFILKTESLDSEQEYLGHALQVKEFLPKGAVHKNREGRTDTDVAQKYFSTIPRKLLYRIYGVYSADFELFHYSPELYFNMTSN